MKTSIEEIREVTRTDGTRERITRRVTVKTDSHEAYVKELSQPTNQELAEHQGGWLTSIFNR